MINESRVQPYYRRDCNLGEGVDALPRARVSKGEVEPDLEGTNVAALRYAAACALGEPDFMALVRRIEAAYEEVRRGRRVGEVRGGGARGTRNGERTRAWLRVRAGSVA